MNRFGSLFMAVVLAAFVAGCGGGGDDGGGPVPPAAPIGLVGGAWTIQELATTADNVLCEAPPGGNNPLDSYTLTVTQTGNDLTVARDADPAVAGTISGDQMTWSGNSYAELGGITTVNSATATVAAGCNNVSGSFTWSHTQATLTCSGTTTFDGVGDGTDCTI